MRTCFRFHKVKAGRLRLTCLVILASLLLLLLLLAAAAAAAAAAVTAAIAKESIFMKLVNLPPFHPHHATAP
jgi:Spy/CpxP family protein refolding chaperone